MADDYLTFILLGCLFQGIGQALQKHGIAAQAPNLTMRQAFGDFRSVWAKVRRNWVWLIGIVLMLIGVGFGIQGIAHGDITVISPLQNLTMVVSLLIGVLVLHERLSGREWLGIVAMVAGSALLASGSHASVAVTPTLQTTALVALSAVGGAVLLIAVAESGRSWLRPELALATGAGMMFGMTDVLIKITTSAVKERTGGFSLADTNSLLTFVAAPHTYLIVLPAIVAFLCLQTAYSSGRVSVVFPVKSVLSVCSAVLLGVVLLQEQVAGMRLAGIAVVLVGTVILVTSRTSAPKPTPVIERKRSAAATGGFASYGETIRQMWRTERR